MQDEDGRFLSNNSQFAGHLRGCWTQFLSENSPRRQIFVPKTAARLLHTFAQNELQPSHTSGNRAVKTATTVAKPASQKSAANSA